MEIKHIGMGVALFMGLGFQAHAETQSFLPKDNLTAFVVEAFDLTTIRSSFGPRRLSGRANHFGDFGLKPAISGNTAVFDTPDWYYSVDILHRGDENGDGLEDVVICFTDKAKGGSYATVTPYLLTRYDAKGPLIALAYKPDTKACS
jgi:hypothetical protein